MSQTILAVQKPGLTAASLAYDAADGTNGNAFANDGRTVAIIKNGSAGPITATFASVPDPYGRISDVVATVPAAGEYVVGPFPETLFNQGAGVNTNSVTVAFSSATTVTMALVSA